MGKRLFAVAIAEETVIADPVEALGQGRVTESGG